MNRTVSIPISLPKKFLSYLEVCSEIFNKYVDWSFKERSYNKNKAHKELYTKFREEYPNIPSAIIQSIRDTALEAVKADKFEHRPRKKPHSHVRYDKRTISLRGNQLSITWSGKRIKTIVNIPKFFKDRYSDWKFQAATIGYDNFKRTFKVNLIFEKENPEVIKDENVVGIDRGIYNVVALSDGTIHDSKKIRAMRRRMLYVKKQLQTKGTKSAKRKLKSLSGYEKRFSLNENHKISKDLANSPYTVFVLEDLTGIRKEKKKNKYNRKGNKQKSNWAFYQLEMFLTYKAEELGKRVEYVDARYTSQKCSCCGYIDSSNRNKSIFHCKRCKYRCHADINAGKNIRMNYLIWLAEKNNQQALVNEPNVSTNDFASQNPRLETSRQPCAGGN